LEALLNPIVRTTFSSLQAGSAQEQLLENGHRWRMVTVARRLQGQSEAFVNRERTAAQGMMPPSTGLHISLLDKTPS
jgi:hypothetical protein